MNFCGHPDGSAGIGPRFTPIYLKDCAQIADPMVNLARKLLGRLVALALAKPGQLQAFAQGTLDLWMESIAVKVSIVTFFPVDGERP
jgi:hypothetical protein